MRHTWTRRGFLGAAAGLGLLTATACGDDEPKGGNPGDGAVKVAHVFGETEIPAPPTRVVSAGLNDHDFLLAVGVIPVALTDWFGAEPLGVWPWAQPQLGAAKPVPLSLANGIQVDQIAAQRPDLIVATNAGLDRDTYNQLSEIAPTVAQSGPNAFFEPWHDQAVTIGGAVYAADQMTTLTDAVDASFDTAGTDNPQFKDVAVLRVQGRFDRDDVVVALPGWRTDFLTRMGMTIPDGLGAYARGDNAYIPRAEAGPVLDTADILIWETETDADQAALLADPMVAALKATRLNRNIFAGKELTGALAYSSPLSLPVVAQRLPPLLAAAL